MIDNNSYVAYNESMKKLNVYELADLAMAVEVTDPIDWGTLSIDERTAYRMMAAHVLEMDLDEITSKAVITKLITENFVLNLKLGTKL